MRERTETALRLFCIALAAVLLLELVVKLVSPNPLSGLKIPALPTLSADAESGAGAKASNTPPGKALQVKADGNGTNAFAAAQPNPVGTNLLAKTSTTQGVHSVHRSSQPKAETNVVAVSNAPTAQANVRVSPAHGTNALAEGKPAGTTSNALAKADSGPSAPHSTRAKSSGKDANSAAPVEIAIPGPNPSLPPGLSKPTPDLPYAMLARVDRVVDSELFGPVFHPMPAGLLGIAGNMAFLRASNGQSGAIKEGDQLGGLKLLRIGINRVLVEEDGQQKELMIFQGLGGQSLLSN